ncbi:hypothetical protein BDC45DRAFT_559127 [Circinella umbellata]|nr:hypothetical protein BDC45DRAFT_559127 [Circinella umbellata]
MHTFRLYLFNINKKYSTNCIIFDHFCRIPKELNNKAPIRKKIITMCILVIIFFHTTINFKKIIQSISLRNTVSADKCSSNFIFMAVAVTNKIFESHLFFFHFPTPGIKGNECSKKTSVDRLEPKKIRGRHI